MRIETTKHEITRTTRVTFEITDHEIQSITVTPLMQRAIREANRHGSPCAILMAYAALANAIEVKEIEK